MQMHHDMLVRHVVPDDHGDRRGVDAIAEILTWNRHAEVIQRTKFIAATRPGFDFEILKKQLPKSYLDKIAAVDSTALGISSTDLRARVKQGRPIRYLTPDGVADYIAQHRLYSAVELASDPA